MDRLSTGFLIFILIITSSCATKLPDLADYKDPRNTSEYKALLESGANIDFFQCPPIEFKQGSPSGNAKFLTSITDFQRRNFNKFYNCIGIYAATPQIYIAINGFSEPTECTSNCVELSESRARMIRNSLLEMNFPKDRILCTKGHGAGYPLDPSNGEPTRNRRVEIWVADKDDANNACKG